MSLLPDCKKSLKTTSANGSVAKWRITFSHEKYVYFCSVASWKVMCLRSPLREAGETLPASQRTVRADNEEVRLKGIRKLTN